MRFTNSISSFVFFFFVFISAIPAPDKYIHYVNAGCDAVGGNNCNKAHWCQLHRAKGDLFHSPNGYPLGRDAPEENALSPPIFTSEKFDVSWKRDLAQRSVRCGILSIPLGIDLSNPFTNLVLRLLYDFVVAYPYQGATGGIVGIFAALNWIETDFRVAHLGASFTADAGYMFTFRARRDVLNYWAVFVGDNLASAVINWYILRHLD